MLSNFFYGNSADIYELAIDELHWYNVLIPFVDLCEWMYIQRDISAFASVIDTSVTRPNFFLFFPLFFPSFLIKNVGKMLSREPVIQGKQVNPLKSKCQLDRV